MDIQFREERFTTFYINGGKICSTKTFKFFKFLNKVAKLKVQNVSVTNLNKSYNKNEIEKKLHNAIHSKLINGNREHIQEFIGVEQACLGCARCLEVAKTAEVYGPITYSSLIKLQKPEKPRKLIITTETLNSMASTFGLESRSKEDCHRSISSHIKPDLLSGDTLILWLSECQEKRGEMGNMAYPFPLEVLEAFIRNWNVKCLQILPVFTHKSKMYDDRWINTDYFTAVRFNDDSDKEHVIKVDHVELDLSNSYYCRRDFSFSHVKSIPHKGYPNIIGSIVQLFSPNTVSIKNFTVVPGHLSNVHGTFNNIMKMIGRSAKLRNQPTLNLNFEYLIQITDVAGFTARTEAGNSIYFNLPEVFFKSNAPHMTYRRSSGFLRPHPEKVKDMKFVSKKFTIEENGLVFNLSVFLNEHALHQNTSNNNVKEFLRFFI
ncbi:unnamed protein product [Caenorhabditis brenneri]